MSRTAVCALMRINWATVGRIVDRFVVEADALRPDLLDGLARIGIDEISYKKGHKYLIVVVCHDTGRLVWAAPGRDAASLRGFFDALGAQRARLLTHISADCAPWIAEVTTERAPQAARCADPFHVVAWATDALDQTRRRIWNSVRPPRRHRLADKSTRARGPAKRLKDARWALWKNPEDLTDNQAATLNWIRTAHPVLHRAYEYKERLRLLLKLPRDSATNALARWIKAAKLSRIPEIRELAIRVARHKTQILAAVEHGLSNGHIESVNTKIRLLTRIAYGFKQPEHLISLIKLALGGYDLQLPRNTRRHLP
jgi:transposase